MELPPASPSAAFSRSLLRELWRESTPALDPGCEDPDDLQSSDKGTVPRTHSIKPYLFCQQADGYSQHLKTKLNNGK